VNRFQKVAGSIASHVGGLPTTAKLLIGALMVILVLSLLVVAQFAGRPSMVALPIDMGPEARAAALSSLERAGIPHEESGGKLLVPADQKFTALAQLNEQSVISGPEIDFDALVRQESPFITREQSRRRWQIAKMNVLSALISRFEGIEKATVMADQPERQGFGEAHVAPTASVNVVPRGEGLTQSQVEAIANLVAGAQPGLKAADVKVIDSKRGRSYQARRAEDLAAGNYLELKQAAEKDVLEKIEHLLRYIPGILISVNALVDARQVERRTDSYEDPKLATIRSQTRSIESRSASQPQEPGIRPNTGVAISGATSGSQLTDERSDEVNQPAFPVAATHTTDRKGYALEVHASIGVPRSYFVGLYRVEKNDPQAAPDDSALEAVAAPHRARIKAAVEPLVATGPFENARQGTVVVSIIPDLLGMTPALPGPPAATESRAAALAWAPPPGLLKYLGLLGLVLLSLAMMFMMVRKAGGPGELPSAQEVAGVPPPLPTDLSEVVGEADESAPAMEGVELDDTALRHQQMLGQISDMVKHSPDDVANLLRRWIRVEA
jgi:flagellar M-ring protein FliF